LRTADDVLPEILADINRSTNAFDRHTKAVDYGGEALATMAEDFRRSEKPLAEWRAHLDASKLDTDAAARSGKAYNQALGELNDTFREVGVELGTALTPLIHEFSTWIKQNKPAIVAGTHEFAEGLKFVAENAKVIAEIFAVAWGVRAVAGVGALIAQVVALNTALAATGTAGALAAGVLGRFGIAGAAVAGIMAAIGLGRATGVVTGKGGPQWDPAWGPRPEGFAAPGPQPPDTVDRVLNPVRRFLGLPAKEAGAPTPPAAAPAAGAPAPPSAAGAPAEPAPPAPIAPISTAPAPTPAAGPRPVQLAGNRTPAPVRASGPLPPEARGLLDTIAGTESSGYDVLYGGRRFGDFSRHPGVNVPITRGPNAGKTSSAAGRYQFIKGTWADEQRRLGLPDFSPASQDVGAWDLAARTYRQKTGRDLQADLRAGRTGQIGPALHDQWTSLPGGIEQGTSESNFGRRLRADADHRGRRRLGRRRRHDHP
jgi:muramidase (phage lysozyme)